MTGYSGWGSMGSGEPELLPPPQLSNSPWSAFASTGLRFGHDPCPRGPPLPARAPEPPPSPGPCWPRSDLPRPGPTHSALLARRWGREPAPTPRRPLPFASPSPRSLPPLPPVARRRRRRRPRLRRRRRAGLGSGSAGGRADMAANMYRVGGRKARPDPARLGAGSGSGGPGRVHPNRRELRAPGPRAQGAGGAGARRGGRDSPPPPPPAPPPTVARRGPAPTLPLRSHPRSVF